MILEHPEVIAAFLSAVAAIAAAVATWRGPLSAARLAERLRRDGDQRHEERRMKLFVFTTIMQERSQIYSLDAVRALNLIDVVFSKSKTVRESWAELHQAFNAENNIPLHVRDERIRKLLRDMAEDLEISDGLRLDDFARIYYPNALAQEQKVQELEREAALRRLGDQLAPSANTAAPQETTESLWPPKPV